MQRRERATPLSPDERRAAIIAATRPLMIARGGDVTTKEIAAAAGVAEGTIFRVFENKRELYWAVAELTMSPPGDRADLERALADLPDLEGKVRVMVGRMIRAGQEFLDVMMALRHALLKDRSGQHADGDERPRPQAFIHEAQAEVLDQLTELIFAPHADELRVTPARAALAVRGLVIGMTHPALHHGDSLEAEEIVDLVMHGLVRGE